MSYVLDEYRKRCESAASDQNWWLEDVLAGLLAAGCAMDEIEVRWFQDEPLRVVVAVRGVPRYEHRINITLRKT